MSSIPTLNSCTFYHGSIDTRECRELLPNVGDFLIRNKALDQGPTGTTTSAILTVAITPDQASMTGKQIPSDYSLKQECTTRLKSYAINGPFGTYSVQGTTETFPTIEGVCAGFVQSKKALPGGGVLQKSVDRKPWQLLLSDIEFPNPEVALGKGSYGKVIKAKLLRKDAQPIDVAVKETNEGSNETTFSEVYNEARAMRRLQHQHIIRLEGVVVEKLPILLVIEFFEGTCLLKHLQSKKVDGPMRLAVVCGIMYGLAYIHSQNYIHRDIAARNVMVSADCRRIKIIDFGLAKHGTTFNMAVPQKIPTKWLAPEVIKMLTFSTKSDVWAFGVTVWEVFHDGAEPYSNMVNVKMKSSVAKKKGKEADDALKITENMDFVPKELEDLLSKIFEKNSRMRPEMTEVVTEMDAVIDVFKKSEKATDKTVYDNIRLLQEQRSKATGPPTSSNASNTTNSGLDKNAVKPKEPKSPQPPSKGTKNLKTVTRRNRGKKPVSKDEKNTGKVTTTRRKTKP